MIAETCEANNNSAQLLHLMHQWRKSVKLVKTAVKSFFSVQKARKKALHSLCKKLALESTSNKEYIDFVKISELAYAVRDKYLAAFIKEKLKSYSQSRRIISFQKHTKLDLKKNSRQKAFSLVVKVPNQLKFKPDLISQVKFSLFCEPLILKTHFLRLLASKHHKIQIPQSSLAKPHKGILKPPGKVTYNL